MALSDLFSRRRKDDSDADSGPVDGPVHSTKALARFLGSLNAHEQPILIDLGPVVGQNVTFFGEELGCKIFVENIYRDVDRHTREGTLAELPAFFEKRFPQESGTVHGILCWDIFDYLERPAAVQLARPLTRLLRDDGMLMALFNTVDPREAEATTYTKYVVADHGNLQYRPYGAARRKQRPLVNREIERMFEPMRVSDQFLLKTRLREVLFRKPAAQPAAPSTTPEKPGPKP